MNTLVYLIFCFFLYIFQCAFLAYFIWASLVGSNGIEPSTSRLSGVRSNHLSYEPIFVEFTLSFFLLLWAYTLFLMYLITILLKVILKYIEK